MDYLRYVQTWVWVWGVVSTSSIVVVIWALLARRTDIAWFRDLHEWTVTHGVSAYNDEHALLKATLDEKLRRMHEIAAKSESKIR